MLYILAFFTGIFTSPFVYMQGYLYYFISQDNSIQKKYSNLIFFVTVFSFLLILFVFTFPLRNWLFSPYKMIYFIIFYMTIFFILYEIYSFFMNQKQFIPIDVPFFIQLFVVVGGMFYSIIKVNLSWQFSFMLLIGFCVGFGLLLLFTKHLYFSILAKYCNPVLKNPMLSVLISVFLASIFYVISQALPKL